ncbi:flagellar C1a complex subunit C1a-32-domain-containing protein [Entophlyctis helioformis]|nr:flagellar C1a complex subunit C1a-32-domain-containing protein [Entophlyctis helioformis]
MANSLVWKDLSMKQIYDYQALRSTQDCQRFIRNIFKLGTDDRSAILLDLYYYTLNFAKENGFTSEQTSAFFSIVRETHLNAMSSPLINMDKDYAFFKTLLLRHSVRRPPFSDKVFDHAEMKAGTEYMTHTYFRHYLMYKYAFTKKLRLDMVVEGFGGGGSAVAADGASGDELAEHEVAAGDAGSIAGGELVKETDGQNVSGGAGTAIDAGAASDVQAETPAASDAQASASHGHGQPSASSQREPPAQKDAMSPQQQPATAVQPQPLASVSEQLDKQAASSQQPMDAPKLQPNASKHDAAVSDLRGFISSVLSAKLDDIRTSLQSKLSVQEDALLAKLRRLDGSIEEDKDKKKDIKGKPKK